MNAGVCAAVIVAADVKLRIPRVYADVRRDVTCRNRV